MDHKNESLKNIFDCTLSVQNNTGPNWRKTFF